MRSGGFLFFLWDCFVKALYWINAVEILKMVSRFIARNILKCNSDDAQRCASNIAIDVYIVLKWFFIIMLWKFRVASLLFEVIVWYLVATNLYTYFYYHVWGDSRFKNTITREKVKLRFFKSILAFAFYVVCFAYMYDVVYPHSTNFRGGSPIDFLSFSLCTALVTSLGDYSITGSSGMMLYTLQVLNTFFFVNMIISQTIPSETVKE